MNPALPTFVATFARAAAFLHAAPLTGDRQLPVRARVAVAALMALALAPARPVLDGDALIAMIPCELLLGLGAGFTARLVLAGAEAGGELISLQLGLGFAAAYDPALGDQAQPIGRLALALAGLAFLAAGGMEAAVRVVAGPFADATTFAAAAGSLIGRSGELLVAAVRFAAPAVLAVSVANVALAFASRAAPALNAFTVMLAGVLIFGGLVLIATAPAFVRDLQFAGIRAVDSAVTVGGPSR